MNDIKKEEYFLLNEKIDKIIQERKILFKESTEEQKSFKKIGSKLTPFSILLLLFIIPIFSIFKIKSPAEFLIGLATACFLLWFWYKIFYALVLNGNRISPWTVGLIDKAKEISAGKLKNAKLAGNLFMGSFFLFFSAVCLIGGFENNNPVAMGVSLGFGAMFFFLGLLGITHYRIGKKPERILFLLKNNRKINIFLFLLISLFCFAIMFSFLADFF